MEAKSECRLRETGRHAANEEGRSPTSRGADQLGQTAILHDGEQPTSSTESDTCVDSFRSCQCDEGEADESWTVEETVDGDPAADVVEEPATERTAEGAADSPPSRSTEVIPGAARGAGIGAAGRRSPGGEVETSAESSRVLTEDEVDSMPRDADGSDAATPATPCPDSLRSESGICSSLESNYQEVPAVDTPADQTGAVDETPRRTELRRLHREMTRQAQQELRCAISAKNEQLHELRTQLRLDRQRAVSEQLLGQRQAATPARQAELFRLKEHIRRLEAERQDLGAEAQLCRIREGQRSAELRRLRLQQKRELCHLAGQTGRQSVQETKELHQLQAAIAQKDQELAGREKQIERLEGQKCYLGEEIFRLTGVEEGFWSDEVLKSASVTDRERGLLRRSSALGSQLRQLQKECKTLKSDNDGLRVAMDTELERPLAIRTQAGERLRETQLLKKKNQELATMTRKLEEKVKTLEKKSKEVTQQQQERTRSRIVRQLPQTRAVPPESEQRAITVHKKTVSWQLRPEFAKEKTANAPQRVVSVPQRTASVQQQVVNGQQRTVSGRQRIVSSPQRTASAESGSSERSVHRGLQQRTTLTAKQRERESEYQRQIKERDSEIKKLRERMKVISDKLSKKNELQILKERGKKELVSVIQQLQRERTKLEHQLNALSEERRNQHESDAERFHSLEEDNSALLSQLNELNKLVQDHKEIQAQFDEKIEECEQLAESLHIKNELCDDLEKQLTRVIEKNTELTIQNSDLQRQIHELDSISSQCASLKESLNNVGTEYESAKFEVESLREKVSTLESVLKQMRDAAERKKELERQHQEAQQQLRTKQEEIQKLTKVSESEKQASLDTIQTLESKIRELEKKAEVQNLRHEELVIEMSSLKKQSKYKINGSPEGTITPDSMLLSNESTARSTPIGTAITPASLDALPEVDETPWLTDPMTASEPAAGPPVYLTSAVTLPPGYTPVAGEQLLQPATFPGYPPVPAGYSVVPVSAPRPGPIAGVYHADKPGMVNGTVPGLMSANMAHQLTAQQLTTPHQPGVVDVLDIPGKGKCQVFIARYSYDPYQHSPNEAPESELRLNAGDYVLVWGEMDEDGFLDGETLDGRRGLVPSNFVQKLIGEDLLEFHRQVVAGLRDCDQTSVSTSVPPDLDFNSADEAFLNNLDDYNGRRAADGVGCPSAAPLGQYPGYSYDGSVFSDDDDDEHVVGCGQSADLFFSVLVPPPRQLTLERQLNKSIVIGWTAPEAVPGTIDCYHLYVDGLLRTTVKATERTCALIEGVDSARPHRISVRSVTPNRRTSRDAACTMLIGKDVPLAPTAVRATNVSATSAVISWMPSNSNHQHTVCVNSVEVRTVKPGVYRHTITGISPNTTYRVSVKVKNITSPQFASRNSKQLERLATHMEFRTLPKGVPEPPVDVQCELGPQEGSVLVTWLPVTINSTSGTSNGAPVTGYAVYADGKKVTELGSPTGDHALIDLHNIHGFHPRQVTVRTKSRDLVSADSVPCPIPQRTQRKSPPADGGSERSDTLMPAPDPELYDILKHTTESLPRPAPNFTSQYSEYESDELSDIPEEAEHDLSDQEQQTEPPRMKPHESVGSVHSSPRSSRSRGPATAAPPRGQHYNQQQVLETEENLSDKEVYPGGYMSIPQIEITKDSASEGRGSVEFSEEDSELRGPRGRRRPPAERARPTPHESGREPRAPRTRPEEYREPAGHSGYRQGATPSSGPSSSRRGRDERMRIFVALFDYDPPSMSPNPDACEEELPFREGQLIKIYGDKDGDGFYWGEASGRSGYVPCNMVSEVQVDDERLAQELLKDEDRPPARSRGSGGGSGGSGSSRPRGQEDRWGDIYSNTPVRRMVALYDYDPQELSPNVDAEVELSFSTGDIIHIFGDMDDDGFYMGEVNGVRGLVPSNFLTETPQCPDPPQAHLAGRARQNYERRRGPEPPSAERRGPPGPGVHGPPLPPRDKGDSRDRRKDGQSEERGRPDERDPAARRRQRW